MVQGYIFDFDTVLLLGIPIWIISRVITLVIRKRKGKKILIGKEIMTNLFALYIIGLVGVTLFPIEIMFGEGIAELKSTVSLDQRLGINLIPFKDYINGFISLQENNIGYFFYLRSLLGNLLLLMPFIGYLSMYKKEIRSIKNVIIISFLTSLSIEVLQLIENITYLSSFPGRSVDIDDLILNTIGGLLGYYIFKIIYKTKLRTYLNMD